MTPPTPAPTPVAAAELPVLRAAYSDRTAARMATLSRLAYAFPAVGDGTGTPASVPPVFATLGFDRITYFHSALTNGWAYLAKGPDLVVLAFRGTQSIQDWHTNFQVEMSNPPNTASKLGVHRGFLAAFDTLNDGGDGLARSIARIRTETEGLVPIYFTGHSLGGALAQIATAVLGSDQIAACYTFGSPRVGNAYFDLWVKPPSYRIENHADIVPQVPVFAPRLPLPEWYRHSGDVRYLPDRVDATPYRYEPGGLTRAGQLAQGLAQWAWTRQILGIKDHAIERYEEKLAAIAAARSQAR